MSEDGDSDEKALTGADITADVEETDSGYEVTRSASLAEVVSKPKEILDSHRFGSDWELYDRLLEIDPELAGTVRAQAQMASGFNVISPANMGEQEEMTEEDEIALKDCKDLVEELQLELIQPSIFKNMIVHGNDINKIIYENGVGVRSLQSLPLRNVTIIDEDTNLITRRAKQEAREYGNTEDIDLDKYIDNIEGTSVQSGDYYVLNEAMGNEKKIESYKILHLAPESRSNWRKDRFDRVTYGVWGAPRVEPIKFALQAKHNTLTNKVAMDDSLIAREVYKIDVEKLYGHIKNDEEREKKAKNYANDLKEKLESMQPDEKPILPEPVDVEIMGAEGHAREHADFLNMMNDAIMHALTFHVGGTGRDAGGPYIGNAPAKDSSQTNVKHLRKLMAHKLKKLFKIHLLLKHPEWRDNHGSPDNIDKWTFREDIEIVVPEVEWDALEEGDMQRLVDVATKAWEKDLITRNEARQLMGFDPADDEKVDKILNDKRRKQEMDLEFQEEQKEIHDDDDESEDDESEDDDDSDDEEAEVAVEMGDILLPDQETEGEVVTVATAHYDDGETDDDRYIVSIHNEEDGERQETLGFVVLEQMKPYESVDIELDDPFDQTDLELPLSPGEYSVQAHLHEYDEDAEQNYGTGMDDQYSSSAVITVPEQGSASSEPVPTGTETRGTPMEGGPNNAQ